MSHCYRHHSLSIYTERSEDRFVCFNEFLIQSGFQSFKLSNASGPIVTVGQYKTYSYKHTDKLFYKSNHFFRTTYPLNVAPNFKAHLSPLLPVRCAHLVCHRGSFEVTLTRFQLTSLRRSVRIHRITSTTTPLVWRYNMKDRRTQKCSFSQTMRSISPFLLLSNR